MDALVGKEVWTAQAGHLWSSGNEWEGRERPASQRWRKVVVSVMHVLMPALEHICQRLSPFEPR